MRRILTMVAALYALLLPLGAQQPTATNYGAFSAAFAAPAMSGTGTATLTYSAGTLYQGGTSKSIVAGTLTSLDASATSCAAPAYSACEFVYWASGTGLLKSNVYATAYNGGANVILGYVTTDGSSLIVAITPASLNLPSPTANISTGFSCGTVAANGACANSTTGGTFHVVFGIATLGSNASTITGISPAFTSASTFFCVANDITTRANPVQAIPASGSTVTFTNTTGASDNVQFICAGS